VTNNKYPFHRARDAKPPHLLIHAKREKPSLSWKFFSDSVVPKLAGTVEQLPELQWSVNAGLAANWPKKLRRSGPIEVAFDFHDRPYYGKQEQEEALWARGEAKDGATRFYRVATAYAILRSQRVTLAIRFVLPRDQTVEVVGELRRTLLLRGLRIGVLYLDKGFSGVPVLKYGQ